MYFDYLRGGPAEPLVGIFRHNQMDLRGLAALAGKILALLDSGNGFANALKAETHDAIDVLGLSRLLRKRGNSTRARELYETALSFGLPRSVEHIAQRELAQLAKRELDYTRAISLWDALRRAPVPGNRSESPLLAEDAQRALESAIEAAEQLAIYYEHRVKEPSRALELVRAATGELQAAQRDGKIAKDRAGKIEARLARRLTRLERRCEGAPPGDANLPAAAGGLQDAIRENGVPGKHRQAVLRPH
jgi:tetratricopeptide (TPR) repeat protein